MKRSYTLFMEDILDSIGKIERYVKGFSYEKFVEDELVFDAVIRNLEIIGEAAKNIPEEIRKKHVDIPWNRMIGLRNIVTHGYFGIDLGIIWEIITRNLPETKPFVVEMIKKSKKE